MGNDAVRAVLDPLAVIAEIPPAVRSHHIERAVAEQAVKLPRVRDPVTGKIFTFCILKKRILLPFPVRFFPILTHLQAPFFGIDTCIK